jgi:hypothetical protein
MEFGKHSPVYLQCHDKQIQLQDLQVSTQQMKLLESIFADPNQVISCVKTQEELKWLDHYLDIPLVEAMLETSYHAFHRLIMNECTIIPFKYQRHDARILELAIENGDYDTFVKAYNMNPDSRIFLLDLAVIFNQMKVLEFLVDHNTYPMGDMIMVASLAAKYDRLEMVKKIGVWDTWTCVNAASEGNITVLQYLHEHGCEWNSSTCAAAARNGHLDCLQYAHQHGCEVNGLVIYQAVKFGHIPCLMYLHQERCPYGAGLCATAAEHGQLEALIFLHEHGYPWGVGCDTNAVDIYC